MSESNVRPITRAEALDLDGALGKFRSALHIDAKADTTTIGDMIEGRTITAMQFILDLMRDEYGFQEDELPFENDLKRYAHYLAEAGERGTYAGFVAWRRAT